jgi:hypothetical protein
MMLGLVLVLVSGAETLEGQWRAVTLEPGELRSFRVPRLETVTAGSGACIEEGMVGDAPETLSLQATCGGVRTTMAWKKGGERVHIMACAEADDRPAHVVALRKTVQGELKALKSKALTACVRNGRVELWGWSASPEEAAKLTALEKKYGLEKVRSFVEPLPEP